MDEFEREVWAHLDAINRREAAELADLLGGLAAVDQVHTWNIPRQAGSGDIAPVSCGSAPDRGAERRSEAVCAGCG